MACPLEPNVETHGNVSWRLDAHLGVVVRYEVADGYLYYAHPELYTERTSLECGKTALGICKTIVYSGDGREILFLEKHILHAAISVPSMCRVEGRDWQRFINTTYE